MQIEIILMVNAIDIGQGRTKSGSRINQQKLKNAVKAKKCDKMGAQGFRITSNMKDQANWYRSYS
jgi:hypothetical protein